MSTGTAEIIVEGWLQPPAPGDFSGVVIPFEATVTKGAAVLRVCTELAEAAHVFVRRFNGSETSAQAEAWIADTAAPILRKAGLILSGECGRMRVLNFDIKCPHKANLAPMRAFDPRDGLENLTSFELETYYDMELPCFVAAADGKIVSAACSPVEEGTDVAEIGVETAPGYEGRGYATGCVRALALELHSRGIRAVYIAQEDNPASISVAHVAGFSEHGSILQLVCIPAGD